LRYLIGIISHGLLLQPSPHFTIIAFANADWGSDPNDRKSTYGYIVYMGLNSIARASNKQKTVSHSTTGVAYRSIVASLTEIKWVHNLFQEI